MPSPRVNRGLCRSLTLAAMLAATFAFSANCSSSSLGPANGSSCNVNGDCASNCCLAGGYPPEAGDFAKVCTEPAGCAGQDSSTPVGDSSTSQDSAAADTGSGSDSSSPVDSSTPDSGGGVDSSMEQDSGEHEDSGKPKDAGKG
jgi:hypothetical protein